MRVGAPFLAADLTDLDLALFSRADEVVAMREIYAGERDPVVIGLRHDMDNVFEPSLELAHWEAERGYRATYFVLHDSRYWNEPQLRPGLEEISSLGHEIGIHVNALAVALETGYSPSAILYDALERLRTWGHVVTGAVAHGDGLCHSVGFVNDEMFSECARPEMGQPDRLLAYGGVRLQLDPRPLADFGLEYDAYRAGPRTLYLSDSGGRWSEPFAELCERFPSPFGQLHVLMHGCWWLEAFARERAVA